MHRVVALILAGGRVDELYPLTQYRPKSAVPFGGFYRIIDEEPVDRVFLNRDVGTTRGNYM